jgi:hypothetical protein
VVPNDENGREYDGRKYRAYEAIAADERLSDQRGDEGKSGE